ncbi:hypothetical protein RND71_013894 [Anisodus tanguticus]|uniref:Putative plant transposon protein domain-containing protein n=1 Tax=Anisodus tanguticus TaxID=243964 RepID=A0AAE1S851_9SOLA|nr:hypothetical protein RND71_013894 [Anisodus tanguticus]
MKYHKRMANKDNELPWVASVISTQDKPQWLDPKFKIKRNSLTIKAKHWLDFITCRFLPINKNQDTSIEKAILLAYIMSIFNINVREIIAYEMGQRADQGQTSLPFPYLISGLCLKAKVPVIPRVEFLIYTEQKVDILKNNDEMNPTTKKRKRSHTYCIV